MKNIPKPVMLVIKLVISIAFFSVLLSFVKGNELIGLLSQINWPFFIVSFVVTVIMVAASCAKWQVILGLKKKVSYWELFRIYLVGYFFSNILPSTVGGDVVRSYYSGRLIKNQSFSAVSVFVERFSGMFFSFLLVIVAPLFKMELYQSPYIYFPAFAGAFFVTITIWVWWAENPFVMIDKISRIVFRSLHRFASVSMFSFLAGAVTFLEKFYDTIIERLTKLRLELNLAVSAMQADKKILWRLIYLTVIFYLLTWVNVYTAFMAFNVQVDFVAVCAIVPAIMLVAYIPVTFLGNLGYFESVFVFYFLLVGVGSTETLAMGLLLRLKMLTMGLIGYVTYLTYKHKYILAAETGVVEKKIEKS